MASQPQAKKTNAKSRLNQRSTTPLHVYVAGGWDIRETGLDGDFRDTEPGVVTADGGVSVPVRQPHLNLEDNAIVQISVGQKHTAALTQKGTVLTWGSNDFYALGRDTPSVGHEGRPEVVQALVNFNVEIVQVAATDHAAFALTSNGRVYGWGTFMSDDGVIGFLKDLIEHKTKVDPDELIAKIPTPIPGLKDIKELATGSNHILALTRTGNVYAWGSGHHGELGRRLVYRHQFESLTPRTISLPKNQIVRVFAGFYHNFAVDKKGRVWAWGLNNFCQAGIPTDTEEGGTDNLHISHPVQVQTLEDIQIKHMAGGLHHSIACAEDGRVLVWGRCDDSQMGASLERVKDNFLLKDERGVPRILMMPLELPGLKANFVAAGTDNCFAIDLDGKIYAWGFSDNFRTGLGTEDSVKEPTLVSTEGLSKLSAKLVVSRGPFTFFAGVPAEADVASEDG